MWAVTVVFFEDDASKLFVFTRSSNNSQLTTIYLYISAVIYISHDRCFH